MFQNLGGGQYLDVAPSVGVAGRADGRSVAITDLDGDGRQDVIVANNDAPPDIYLNRSASAEALTLELRGACRSRQPASLGDAARRCSSRDAVGARVRLTLRSAQGARRTLTRWVEGGSGYAAQSSFALHFGLGHAARVESLEIAWPSGRVERFDGDALAGRRRLQIREGAGHSSAAPPITAAFEARGDNAREQVLEAG